MGSTKKRLLPAEETNNRRLFYGVVTDAAARRSMASRCGCRGRRGGRHATSPCQSPAAIRTSRRDTTSSSTRPASSRCRWSQGDWPADAADGLDTANVPGREGQPVTYEVNFRLAARGRRLPRWTASSTGAGRPKVTLTPVAGATPAARADRASRPTALSPSQLRPAGTYQFSLGGHRGDRAGHRHQPGGAFQGPVRPRKPAQRQGGRRDRRGSLPCCMRPPPGAGRGRRRSHPRAISRSTTCPRAAIGWRSAGRRSTTLR